MNKKELIREALKAREKSYCPYSGYAVGAALISKDGKIVSGCNVENASYGAANCAERTAFFKAISEGIKDFEAIAVCGGEKKQKELTGYAYPCGICRQVMREFCNPEEFKVIVAKNEDEYEEYILEELLSHSFGPENLSN